MAKSVNPHAAGASPSAPLEAAPITPRRNMVAAIAATLIGAFVGLVPFAVGVATFLDPLLRRKRGGEGDDKQWRRVASLEALPADGTPVQVPVIADLTDAW